VSSRSFERRRVVESREHQRDRIGLFHVEHFTRPLAAKMFHVKHRRRRIIVEFI